MKKYFCPQCKTVEVIRTSQYGTSPRCQSCLEINKTNRLTASKMRRKSGNALSHHDKNGVRYKDRFVERQETCADCTRTFILKKRPPPRRRILCIKCAEVDAAKIRKLKCQKTIANYHKDPLAAKRRRLSRTLRSLGLSIEWYDAQPKVCGICGSDSPGTGRRADSWCIDHNHKCCPYGVRAGCQKCIRGLLCFKCNSGLGHFDDDPKRLLAAAAWVTAHPIK